MNGGPRLFSAGQSWKYRWNWSGYAAGLSAQNQSQQSAPWNGNVRADGPSNFQGMQQGSMNLVFAAAIGRALSGGFSGGPQQMNSEAGQPIKMRLCGLNQLRLPVVRGTIWWNRSSWEKAV